MDRILSTARGQRDRTAAGTRIPGGPDRAARCRHHAQAL